MEPYGYYGDVNREGEFFKIACPPGYGLGFLKFDNNTLVLGCHTIFYERSISQYETRNTSTNIVLGSTLGPLGLMFITLIVLGIYRNYKYKKGATVPLVNKDEYKAIVSMTPESYKMSAKERVTALLSAGGLHDFEFGYLSSSLKTELMQLRLKEGRDLMEFVEYADQLNCPVLATYVRELNPGMFPANIRNMKYTRDSYPMPNAPPV
jgi:hypothetical protein